MERATIGVAAWAPVTAAVLVQAHWALAGGLAVVAFLTTVIMYSPSKKPGSGDG